MILRQLASFNSIITILFLSWFLTLPSGAETLLGQTHGGRPVVEKLDVRGLPAGRHDLYMLVVWPENGQQGYIPLMIMKGRKPGRTLMLTASVHGDELNGIRVIHKLFDRLDPAALAGTVVAVPGVNQPGMDAGSRFFPGRMDTNQDDLNRAFPGSKAKDSGSAAFFASQLWEKLFAHNVDMAVDLHTQAQGAAYPVFVFADFGNQTARAMAYALQPDIIKNDPGQKGALETAFLEAGIPAVTFELGRPNRIEKTIVDRGVAGLANLLAAHGFVAAPQEHSQHAAVPFVGADHSDVRAIEGGLALLKVGLLDDVKKGQHVATIIDPFGYEIRRYYAPHAGRILAIITSPLRDQGDMLVRIIH